MLNAGFTRNLAGGHNEKIGKSFASASYFFGFMSRIGLKLKCPDVKLRTADLEHGGLHYFLLDFPNGLTTMSLFRFRSNESTNRSNLGHSSLSLEQLEDRMMLSSVQIFAAGTQGGEQFALQVDGFTVETFTAGAGAESGNF